LKIGKFINSNKGFFLLSLAAAILGLVISFVFGGCSKNDEPSQIIVSKRVKIDVKEAVNAPITEGGDKKPAASGGRPLAAKARIQHTRAPKKIKTRKVKKVLKKSAKKHRAPLKTLQRSWVINVASFTRRPEAEKLKKRLSSSGYNVYITKFQKGSVLYYRVRVGFYATSNEARKKGRVIASAFRGVGSAWVSKPGMDEIISHSK